MQALTTRASSINRALDQIGDKWCLLIIQEVFWGINTARSRWCRRATALGLSMAVAEVLAACVAKPMSTAATPSIT